MTGENHFREATDATKPGSDVESLPKSIGVSNWLNSESNLLRIVDHSFISQKVKYKLLCKSNSGLETNNDSSGIDNKIIRATTPYANSLCDSKIKNCLDHENFTANIAENHCKNQVDCNNKINNINNNNNNSNNNNNHKETSTRDVKPLSQNKGKMNLRLNNMKGKGGKLTKRLRKKESLTRKNPNPEEIEMVSTDNLSEANFRQIISINRDTKEETKASDHNGSLNEMNNMPPSRTKHATKVRFCWFCQKETTLNTF